MHLAGIATEKLYATGCLGNLHLQRNMSLTKQLNACFKDASKHGVFQVDPMVYCRVPAE
jgi:hypothetical protein